MRRRFNGPTLAHHPAWRMEEKRLQYFRNAYEKALRLSYAIAFAGHYLSRQSRNELRERWIGAIKAGKQLIFSFSGFHEDVDEIYVALLAVKCDLLAPRQALEDLNDNETFQKYKKDLSRLIRQMASCS